jgi:hypothetical protein
MKKRRNEMLRKSNKKLRLIGLIALALVLSLGSFAAVFAKGDPIIGSEASPVDATLTKVLKTPLNTALPTAGITYTFGFEKVSIDSGAASLSDMPAISDKTISFTSSDTSVTSGDTVTYTKELTPTIFNGVMFTKAGIYVYKVTEKQTNEAASSSTETWANSDAEYLVSVYVREKASPNTGQYYIYAIGARIKVADYDGQGDEGDKVNPKPGGDPDVSGDYSDMTFTNTYIKSNGGTDPKDPDPKNSSIMVSKAVPSGTLASTTRYFAFSVKVTRPSVAVAPDVFKGYVVSSANAIVTNSNNGAVVTAAAGDPGNYIAFANGVATNVYLQAGQRLVFINAPFGTSYVASEPGTEGYIPSARIVVNGATAIDIPASTDPTLKPGDPLSAGLRYIGAAANTAAFTNTYSDDPPTGIKMNTLPYYVLLLVGVGALIAVGIVRNRRKKIRS